MDSALGELQSAKAEQAQQLEASLDSVTVQLEATGNQLEALEKRLDVEHRLQQNMFEDTQAQLRKQNERLRQIMVAAVFALLLAAAAGAILFWWVR
jgi:sensor domain CHASE-containing protein